MLDAAPLLDLADAAPVQPRARGDARVRVEVRRGRSRLAGLRQQGSAKCLLPAGIEPPEAVLLNTAGGLTGGDRFRWTAEAGEGAALTVSTQAAERLYRARWSETARVETRLMLEPGATLHWLPQETIAFDGAALDRRLEIDMAADATLLALEPLVLGRAAMGETVRDLRLRDRWRLRRGGRLVHADALRLVGDAAVLTEGPAVFDGARAAASLVYAAPDAELRLVSARAALDSLPADALGGASLRDGLIVARLLAPTGLSLRKALLRLLPVFRADPPPRVWSL